MAISVSEVFPELTPRQTEVCVLLIKGYTSKRVAQVLGISHRTVEDHRLKIMNVCDAINIGQVAVKLCGSPEITA